VLATAGYGIRKYTLQHPRAFGVLSNGRTILLIALHNGLSIVSLIHPFLQTTHTHILYAHCYPSDLAWLQLRDVPLFTPLLPPILHTHTHTHTLHSLGACKVINTITTAVILTPYCTHTCICTIQELYEVVYYIYACVYVYIIIILLLCSHVI